MATVLIVSYNLISAICYFLIILLLIDTVLSWIPQLKMTSVGRLISSISEPFLRPCRKLLYKVRFLRNLPIDFSPVLAMIIIEIFDTLFRIICIYLLGLLG